MDREAGQTPGTALLKIMRLAWSSLVTSVAAAPRLDAPRNLAQDVSYYSAELFIHFLLHAAREPFAQKGAKCPSPHATVTIVH
jgi:hypothetical protein